MIHITRLEVGAKVCYQPDYYSENEWENGIIKTIPANVGETKSVFVVYSCAGNWDKYVDYTGALTKVNSLTLGWK